MSKVPVAFADVLEVVLELAVVCKDELEAVRPITVRPPSSEDESSEFEAALTIFAKGLCLRQGI